MSRKRMAKCLALCALALTVCVGIAAALVISKHRGNIARTIAGTERRIGQRETVGTSAQGADTSRKPAA